MKALPKRARRLPRDTLIRDVFATFHRDTFVGQTRFFVRRELKRTSRPEAICPRRFRISSRITTTPARPTVLKSVSSENRDAAAAASRSDLSIRPEQETVNPAHRSSNLGDLHCTTVVNHILQFLRASVALSGYIRFFPLLLARAPSLHLYAPPFPSTLLEKLYEFVTRYVPLTRRDHFIPRDN